MTVRLLVPSLVVGALVLDAAADILPDQKILGGLLGPVTPSRVLLLLGLGALVSAGARARHFHTGLDLPIALLVLATALATVRYTDWAALRFLLTAVALYYLTVGLVRLDPEARIALPLVALAAVAIAAAIGVEQVAQGTPTTFYRQGLFEPVDSDRPLPGLRIRAIGTFPNPNLLAAFLLILGPFAALAAATARRRGARVVAVGIVVLAYIGLWVALSRAVIIAVVVSVGVTGLILLTRTPHWLHRAGLGSHLAPHLGSRRSRLAAWSAFAATGAVLLLAGVTGMIGRLSGRAEAFTLATRAAEGHLLTGVGPRQAGEVMNAFGHAGPPYAHPHNLWLTWLLETGVLGFAAIALVTVGGLVAGARVAAAGFPLGIAGFASLSGFCVMSLVDHPANVERIAMVFWFALALLMADTRPGRLKPCRTPRPHSVAVDRPSGSGIAVTVRTGRAHGLGDRHLDRARTPASVPELVNGYPPRSRPPNSTGSRTAVGRRRAGVSEPLASRPRTPTGDHRFRSQARHRPPPSTDTHSPSRTHATRATHARHGTRHPSGTNDGT